MRVGQAQGRCLDYLFFEANLLFNGFLAQH